MHLDRLTRASEPPRYEHTASLLERAARRGPIRRAALGAWRAVWRDRRRAAFQIRHQLRRAQRRLKPWERRLVAAFLWAMVRSHRMWRLILETPGWDGAALWTSWLVFQGLPVTRGSAARGAPNAAVLATFADLPGLRAAMRDRLRAASTDGERVGLGLSVPDAVAERLVNDLGPSDAAALAEHASRRAPLDLRVNPALADRERVRAQLAADGHDTESHPLSPWALRALRRFDVRRHPLYRDGHLDVQDAGSQWLAAQVGARPGERVLDYCAGAGGKTLALAAEVGDTGRVWAWDIRANRLDDLRTRAARSRLDDARLVVGERPSAPVDAVLVDAPCTGSGTLRRDPCLRWRLDDARIAAQVTAQEEVLDEAWSHVARGGRLIYGTCSVFDVENRVRVEAFSKRWPSAALTEQRRLLPHAHDTDGFFVAVLHRT